MSPSSSESSGIRGGVRWPVIQARNSLCLSGFLLTVTFSSQVPAQDDADSPGPSQQWANNPSLSDAGGLGRARRRNTLTFGASAGGIWGGAYTSERNLTANGALQVVYTDGHTEPVDFTVWTLGLFAAYEYGPGDLRLQITGLARFDLEAYSAGANGYELLSGSGTISSRYALLIGPAVTLAEATMGSLDAGIGVGPVVGKFQPLAGVADSITTVLGAVPGTAPASHSVTGVGGRAWVSAMFWRPDRKFGIGLGIYCDVDWLHADLPKPWPRIWVDEAFGVMLPLSSRF